MEALGIHEIEVVEDVRLQDVRVKPGNAVGRVAAHDGEPCHMDDASAVSGDDGGLLLPFRLVGKPSRHLDKEPPVDLPDDLEVAGEQVPHQLLRPRLDASGRIVWFV